MKLRNKLQIQEWDDKKNNFDDIKHMRSDNMHWKAVKSTRMQVQNFKLAHSSQTENQSHLSICFYRYNNGGSEHARKLA
jgi:hypothetical protein